MKGKKDCIKYTKPFIYYNIPLLLQGLAVIERLMPILFKAFRASFGMIMVIEISRIVSRVLILLAYCYIGNVRKYCWRLIQCKKISDDYSDELCEMNERMTNSELKFDDYRDTT